MLYRNIAFLKITICFHKVMKCNIKCLMEIYFSPQDFFSALSASDLCVCVCVVGGGGGGGIGCCCSGSPSF